MLFNNESKNYRDVNFCRLVKGWILEGNGCLKQRSEVSIKCENDESIEAM
jgi:hypothetical protein